jgi:hypothetical protein
LSACSHSFVALPAELHAHATKRTPPLRSLQPLALLLQLALERAASLLNRVVAGDPELVGGVGGGYESIRGPLAEAYAEAGLSDVANFIAAA